jgi:hypothetical protein
MGLKSGHETNFSIDKLKIDNILVILQHRKLRRPSEHHLGPVVDIDASWVVRRACNLSYDMRVMSLMRLSVLFMKKGCRVNIIFDGNKRHHSKKSTIKRAVDCYRNKIDHHVLKFDLSRMYEEINTTDTEEQKQLLMKKINDLKKKIKSMEKRMSEPFIDVGDVLVEKVKMQIEKITSDFGELFAKKLTYMIAEFQADTVLAFRTVNKNNDIVISSDSDQVVHSGHDCICIKGYSLKDKNNKTNIDDISIFCSSKKTLEYICDVLNLPLTSSSIKIPKYPIMEYSDIRFRCLIAIGIGCDVLIDGVPGVTPKSIHDYMDKYFQQNDHQIQIYDSLMDYYINMMKKYMKKTKKTSILMR